MNEKSTGETYTIITPSLRKSAHRPFRAMRSEVRTLQLMQSLNKLELPAKVSYALLSLAVVSEHLSLDKYGVFMVSGISREHRSTVVKNILDREYKQGILTRHENCPVEITSLRSRVLKECPPLVRREYRESEKIRPRDNDIAIIYEDCKGRIDREWRVYLEGMAYRRDTYQFAHERVQATLSALTTFRTILDSNALERWASPMTDAIHDNLQLLLRCYDLDDRYRHGLKKLARLNSGISSAVLAGLALTDIGESILM